MRNNEKKEFFLTLEKEYDEVTLQELTNIVEKIEKEKLKYKESYGLLKSRKVREIYACLGMAYYKGYDYAMNRILPVEALFVKQELLKFRDSIRENTVRDFVKDYDDEDFKFLETLVFEDDKILNYEQKFLYINELRYLNGEIECAIPKINIKKKNIPKQRQRKRKKEIPQLEEE